MFKAFNKLFDGFSALFDTFEKELDAETETFARVDPLKDGETEKITTEEERKPDGTIITRKTIIRRSVTTSVSATKIKK